MTEQIWGYASHVLMGPDCWIRMWTALIETYQTRGLELPKKGGQDPQYLHPATNCWSKHFANPRSTHMMIPLFSFIHTRLCQRERTNFPRTKCHLFATPKHWNHKLEDSAWPQIHCASQSDKLRFNALKGKAPSFKRFGCKAQLFCKNQLRVIYGKTRFAANKHSTQDPWISRRYEYPRSNAQNRRIVAPDRSGRHVRFW